MVAEFLPRFRGCVRTDSGAASSRQVLVEELADEVIEMNPDQLEKYMKVGGTSGPPTAGTYSSTDSAGLLKFRIFPGRCLSLNFLFSFFFWFFRGVFAITGFRDPEL